MKKAFQNKTILVTGGTGSVGSELVRQLIQYKPKQIRVYSRDENKQHILCEKIGTDAPVIYLIGDIRDKERLSFALKGVDIVLHAAAMKHVHLCEYNPFEAVKTNIVGSQNLIDAAIERNVKKVIGISTDKAVQPSGVLGTSKLMMEKLLLNANNYTKKDATAFSCVRFGNILWSNGSVLHVWREQATHEKKIRVTDTRMTRFFMLKEQAITLVLKATVLAKGGELFTFRMPSIGLKDLADIFIEKYFPNENITIEVVGDRGGEKVHEELFDMSNLNQEIFYGDDLFIIVSPKRFRGLYDIPKKSEPYEGFKNVTEKNRFSSKNSIDLERIKRAL